MLFLPIQQFIFFALVFRMRWMPASTTRSVQRLLRSLIQVDLPVAAPPVGSRVASELPERRQRKHQPETNLERGIVRHCAPHIYPPHVSLHALHRHEAIPSPRSPLSPLSARVYVLSSSPHEAPRKPSQVSGYVPATQRSPNPATVSGSVKMYSAERQRRGRGCCRVRSA